MILSCTVYEMLRDLECASGVIEIITGDSNKTQFTRCSRLFNRYDNRLYRVNGV